MVGGVGFAMGPGVDTMAAESVPTAILAWHGTRSAEGRADTARLTSLLEKRLRRDAPGVRVVAGFVDEKVQEPALSDVIASELASSSDSVVVLPAFIAAGYHVRHDIGAAAEEATRADRARMGRVTVTPHLGKDARGGTEPRLVDAVLAAAGAGADGGARPDTATDAADSPIVLASAGSAWEAVAVEIELLRRAVAERAEDREVRHAVLDADFAVAEGETTVPLLLARGFFASRARAGGVAQSPLLGDPPAVDHIVEALAERYEGALGREQR